MVTAVACLLAAGKHEASGFEYRWFSDESTYLAELEGPVFNNDFGSTPPPGAIPDPLRATGGGGLSYEVMANGGLYRVFDGPYAITPLNPATPLEFRSVSNAAAFGGRFSLTDFDERRTAGTFSLTMSLGSGTALVSATTVAIARPDQPTFVGLVAYGLPSAVSGVTLSTTASELFVTSERVSVGSPPRVVIIDVPAGQVRQDAAGHSLLVGQTPVEKRGAGTLVLDRANTLTGTLTVREGGVQLAMGDAFSGEKLVVEPSARLEVAPAVIATLPAVELAAGAVLDVTSGAVVVRSGLTAESVVSLLVEGRGDGSWNGQSGVVSSTAAGEIANGGFRSVGWMDDGTGAIMVGYAAPGDANLDSQVDIIDISLMFASGKLDTGLPAVWSEGDFGYDGIVDIIDIAEFFSTGLYDAGSYFPAPAAAAVAAVPEPGLTWFAVAAAVGVAAVGRRRWRA
jgi:autotransporter-associated beta strand protein